MKDLLSLEINEIENTMKDLGEPTYRASQIFSWLSKGITDFNEMKNLPKELKEKLSRDYSIVNPIIRSQQISREDGTRKYLLEFQDGNAVEAVLMKYKYGYSICISSQAGCRMGCRFCASTVNGLSRNLSSGEMLSEVLTVEKSLVEKSLRKDNLRIGHIVIMGTGEPLDNYNNVSKFIRLVHEPKGLNISMRNITLSTCGIVPMIDRFSEDFPQTNLAISLHGVNDEIRSSMMPINNKYPVADLIAAAKRYTEKTGRRITFEYTMVNGINDSDEDGEKLANLLRNMLCHVNIIPLNKVEGSGFDTVSKQRAFEFAKLLEERNIKATVRRELGGDIDAACGQLRLKNNH